MLTLAGVAATGDEEFFSIISAGIFLFFLSSQSPENFIFGILHAKKNIFLLTSPLLGFHKKNYGAVEGLLCLRATL